MKTDAEILDLLMLAAQAAEIIVYGVHYALEGQLISLTVAPTSGTNTAWNPWDDDGDALRLAVKLGLDLELDSFGMDSGPCVNVNHKHWSRNGYSRVLFEAHGGDQLAAARHAIVRTAAKVATLGS